MDTKLKKYKGIISFICISLSTLILSALVASVPFVLSNWESVLYVTKNANKSSYLESTFVDEIVVNALIKSFTRFEAIQEDNQYYLNSLTMDANMYLELRRGGKVLLKSSHEDIKNAGILTKMPEEYTSLYSYKNGKLEHRINGKDIDIYGDNVYEHGDLRVPGYKNYIANKNQLDVELLIAFKANPINYLEADEYVYASSTVAQKAPTAGANSSVEYQDHTLNTIEGNITQVYESYDNYSRVYDAKQMFDLAELVFVGVIVGIAIVLGMLVVGCVFYPHKKLVDAFIAKLTRYIPFEFKLFCIVMAVATWISFLLYHFNYYNSMLVNLIIMVPLTIVAIYLLKNDIVYNRPIYKQSVVYLIYKLIAQQEVKKGVYRKLIRLVILVVVAAGIWAFSAVMVLIAISYNAYMYILIFAIIGAVMAAICILSGMEIINICKNTGDLLDYLQRLSNGEQVSVPTVKGCVELNDAAQQLRNLEQSLQGSITKQMQSERMKIELIANVSHDIKTPLTSVISYIDLLKEENDLPQHVKEYITVLDQKSQRLKNMVQDIFEVSKAASGQLTVNMEKLDLCRLIRQTLADAQENIAASGMIICESVPAEPCEVMADGDKMYRVYQNLVLNALKYSLAGSRIHINLEQKDGKAIVSVKNVSAMPIDDSVDFTQRFVRGDDSRTDGGSGLGLSIASSFTATCGGEFRVDINADMFCAYTEFTLL